MRGVVFNPADDTFAFRADLPVPTPGPGEARVRVLACGLNPVDAKAAQWKGMMRVLSAGAAVHQRHIPGLDVCGIVDALGPPGGDADPDCHARIAVGDRVLYHGRMCEPSGGLADFALHDTTTMLRAPAALSDAVCASVPCAAWTAAKIVHDKCHVGAGAHVLVWGCTGGVGSYCLQMARAAGAARIVGVCSGRNAARAKALGATDVVDYTKYASPDAVAEAVMALTADGRGVDAAIDLVGDATAAAAASCLAFDGVLVPAVSDLLSPRPAPGGAAADAATTRPRDAFQRGLCVAQVSLGAAHLHGPRARAGLRALGRRATDAVVAGDLWAAVPLREVASLARVPAALERLRGAHTAGKVVWVAPPRWPGRAPDGGWNPWPDRPVPVPRGAPDAPLPVPPAAAGGESFAAQRGTFTCGWSNATFGGRRAAVATGPGGGGGDGEGAGAAFDGLMRVAAVTQQNAHVDSNLVRLARDHPAAQPRVKARMAEVCAHIDAHPDDAAVRQFLRYYPELSPDFAPPKELFDLGGRELHCVHKTLCDLI